MTTITDAVAHAGGHVALAKLLEVHPSLISQWTTGRLKVAARHCIAIEEATGVSRHDLRPDIFGAPPALAADPDANRIVPVEGA